MCGLMNTKHDKISWASGRRGWLLLVAAVVLIVAVLFLWRCKVPIPQVSEVKKASLSETTNAHRVLEERKELDQTVWKDEILAQQYERTFIRLWDDLRATDDPFAVLATFKFDKLKIGKPNNPEKLEDGITRWHISKIGQERNMEEWAASLNEYKNQGWHIVQTEWHHRRFEPPAEGPARSSFNVILHVRKKDARHRVIIDGMIHVTWTDRKDGHGNFIPKMIDAGLMDIYERDSFSPFKVAQILPWWTEHSLHPLLVYDLNGDGLDEIVLAGVNRVYWNKGGMMFSEDLLLATPPPDIRGAVLGDFTGDGWVDILAGGQGSYPLLFEGDEQGRFLYPPKEIRATGHTLTNPQCITAGDIDGDGDIDAWVTQYKQLYHLGQMPTPYYDANDGFASYLLINDNGTFRDGTEEAGLATKRFRRTYSSSFIDLDEDGDLDLLVVSDFSGADVYLNDGEGRFTDVTGEALDEGAAFGMSYTSGDFNLDGRLDLYVVGMTSTTAQRLHQLGLGRIDFPKHQDMRMKMAYGNRLYLGGPGHAFRQSPLSRDVVHAGWSWGAANLDVDLDGDSDIYVTNGHVSRESATDYCSVFWRHDIYTGSSQTDEQINHVFQTSIQDATQRGMSWNGFEHNKLFINQGGKGFVEAAFLMGIALEDDGRAVVATDLDADGRTDLLVVSSELFAAPIKLSSSVNGEAFRERLIVLRNIWPKGQHWIGIRLAGQRSPLGARIIVSSNGRKYLHHVVSGDSFQAQHPAAKVFGLGEHEKVDYIEVRWPGGVIERVENPKVDRYHALGTRG